MFVSQIVSGIWLVMEYTPTGDASFSSVQHYYALKFVMAGCCVSCIPPALLHFLPVVYFAHVYRGLIYGSYQKPTWVIVADWYGYLCHAADGKPSPVMYYRGVKCLIGVCNSYYLVCERIPYIGDMILVWVRGGYSVTGVSLHRFFSLHVYCHSVYYCVCLYSCIWLRWTMLVQTNPDGIDIKEKKTAVAYH